ncbi:MAG: ABC transporter permease [Clostridiales Family XIII bacterium]|jgi:ribose/xylose/arabinose/galactoside ABC-type transport system permease subunit|nr:ABC transporter permease [Clostridiales Family XIII bacterium]
MVEGIRLGTGKAFNKQTMMQNIITLGILIVLFIVLSIVSDSFLSASNMITVLRQVVMVVVVGAGVTLLMIAGNIDLSVGSVLALSGVVYASLAVKGVPLFVGALVAVAMGCACGVLNALMVTKLNVTPVIATMGIMYAARGLALVLAGGHTITMGLPMNFNEFGRSTIGGVVPTTVIIMLIIVLVFIFIQTKTVLGKYSFAIGGNAHAAIFSGINIKKYVSWLFIIVGILTGFAGVITASRLGVGDPNAGSGFEFDVIVAVVLGGTSMNGGEGSVTGMVVGALIVGFLANGLNLLGVDSFYQYILKGAVLVGAVVMDSALKKKFA